MSWTTIIEFERQLEPLIKMTQELHVQTQAEISIIKRELYELHQTVDKMYESQRELLQILKYGPLSQIALDANTDFEKMKTDNSQ